MCAPHIMVKNTTHENVIIQRNIWSKLRTIKLLNSEIFLLEITTINIKPMYRNPFGQTYWECCNLVNI
jgi:hypothetical protein